MPVAIIGSGNIGTDLMIKIMRTSKTLELTSPVWSWFCVMKDDCLPPTGVKLSVRDEGDEAMDDGIRVKIEPCAKRVRVYLGERSSSTRSARSSSGKCHITPPTISRWQKSA